MSEILDQYKIGISEKLGLKDFSIEKKKRSNVFLVEITPDPQNTKRLFRKLLDINIVFSDHNGVYTTEILRRKGDYLSFMEFYGKMFEHFNVQKI